MCRGCGIGSPSARRKLPGIGSPSARLKNPRIVESVSVIFGNLSQKLPGRLRDREFEVGTAVIYKICDFPKIEHPRVTTSSLFDGTQNYPKELKIHVHTFSRIDQSELPHPDPSYPTSRT